MQAFTVHTGRAVPLRRTNVDTDQIIPSDYLKRVSRTGFADGLFRQWRDDAGARGETFVLEDPAYLGASILVTGQDFGTGSSREHAVWALQDWGFRAVISTRFADIFRGNALKGGLLPVVLSEADIESLLTLIEARPQVEVTVDLVARVVRAGDIAAPFPLEDFTRWRLMEGLDDIGLTLRHEADITAFESGRAPWLPRTG